MFSPTFKDFGTIKQGSTNTINISFDSSVKMITRLTTPCGCVTAMVDIVGRQVVIIYTPKDVPIHLVREHKNSYNSTQVIEIEYESIDGTESKQSIVITAIVTT